MSLMVLEIYLQKQRKKIKDPAEDEVKHSLKILNLLVRDAEMMSIKSDLLKIIADEETYKWVD